MKNIFQLFLFAILLNTTACYQEPSIEGHFNEKHYVRNEGADMPVWVRGNINAETFIIFIHGGPSLSGIETAITREYAVLEEDYGLVYYDQRGGGFTHGHTTVNLTEEQLYDDLDVIVDFVKSKYTNAKSVFLLGESWGGYVGTGYLLDATRQSKITGWIECAGSHNLAISWWLSKEKCLEVIDEKLTVNPNDDFWKEQQENLITTTEINNYADIMKINYPAQLIDREVSTDSPLDPTTKVEWATSPAATGMDQVNNPAWFETLVNGNHNPLMHQITLPSLLIYGGRDPIVPIKMGQNGYEFLGTPDEDKELVIFENSGHIVSNIEHDRFNKTVKSFIEKYE